MRMPQNSKPYWWAACGRASTRASPPTAIGSRPLGTPAAAWDRRGDVGQRLGDVVEEADADLLEPAVALVGGEVHHPEHRAVVVPEGEEGVHELERRGDRLGPAHDPSVMISVRCWPCCAISSASTRIAASTSAKYW